MLFGLCETTFGIEKIRFREKFPIYSKTYVKPVQI